MKSSVRSLNSLEITAEEVMTQLGYGRLPTELNGGPGHLQFGESQPGLWRVHESNGELIVFAAGYGGEPNSHGVRVFHVHLSADEVIEIVNCALQNGLISLRERHSTANHEQLDTALSHLDEATAALSRFKQQRLEDQPKTSNMLAIPAVQQP